MWPKLFHGVMRLRKFRVVKGLGRALQRIAVNQVYLSDLNDGNPL